MTRFAKAGNIFILLYIVILALPACLSAAPSVTPDWAGYGKQAGASFGNCVARAGDINGDGFEDVISGAYQYDSTYTDRGAVFVYLGSASGIPAVLSDTLFGPLQDSTYFGNSAAGAGDVNNDGYDDVIVSANGYPKKKGSIFLFLGSSSGLVPTDWRFENPSSGNFFGYSIASAGDVNNDGHSDIVIGDPGYSSNTGRVYVFLGSDTGLADNNPDYTITGSAAGIQFGWSVSSAGDIDNDGYNDIVVGAPKYPDAGQSNGAIYVYKGNSSGLSTPQSWRGVGPIINSRLGTSVACAGDVNGDNFSDIVTGAPGYSNTESNEGAVFVYHGGLSIPPAPAPSWKIEGNFSNTNSGLGLSVAGVGDLNNDGYADVAAGAPQYQNDASANQEGAVFAYYGSASGLSLSVNWTVKSNQAMGFPRLFISGTGNIKNNGHGGIMIGAPLYDNPTINEGALFIYYGTSGGLTPRAVTPLSPSKDSMGIDSAKIAWKGNSVATGGYQFQLSTSSGFITNQTTTVTKSPGDTSYFFNTGLPNTKYFWRVSALDGLGAIVTFSDVWCFTTQLSKPATISPSTSGTSLTPQFTWTSPSGAQSYTLQVASDPGFSALIVNHQDITTNSFPLGPGILNTYTTYYWRVKAHTAGDNFSKWSDYSNFTTVVAAPVLKTPDSCALGISLTPTAQWNSVSGAESYSIEIATSETFSSILFYGSTASTAFSIPAPGLTHNTKYYWRVKALQGGASGAWSSVWNFNTMLASPVLKSPAADTTKVILTPVMEWNAATGATLYSLQIAKDAQFNQKVFSPSGISGTSITVPVDTLQFLTKYYWRVRAYNSLADTSQWSSIWNFTTIIDKPDVPVHKSPVDLSTNIPINPSLQWHPAARADSYTVQMSLINDFSKDTIIDTTIPDTLFNSPSSLQYDTSYYWRVNAGNTGGVSAWSISWKFSTITDTPSVPTLMSPIHNAKDIPLTPTLNWNAAAGALFYTVQVSLKNDFSDSAIAKDSVHATSFSIPASTLLNDTYYYWRVNATNSTGTSLWSDTFAFKTVLQKPGIPVLNSPPDSAMDVPLTATFSWGAVARAARYTLHVATSNSFSDSIVFQNNLTDTTFPVPSGKFSNETSYFWRVNAANNGGTSTWSDSNVFITIVDTPDIPIVASPANGAAAQPLAAELSWHHSPRAVAYRLVVSSSSDFSSPVIDTSLDTANTSDTSVVIPGNRLTNNTTYYWHINAGNSGGTSDWSGAWYFTTMRAAPDMPTLKEPTDGQLNVQTIPTFYWNNAQRADSYTLEIAADQNFTSVIDSISGITVTYYQITSALANNTKYYWRLFAVNEAGAGNWSAVWNFTTTVRTLQTPKLLSPVNGALGVSIGPLLKWEDTTTGATYTVQVSYNSIFDSLGRIVDTSGIVGESLAVSSLHYFTNYYWRVKAVKGLETSNWSEAGGYFKTTIGPPVVISPVNGSAGINLTPVLRWNRSSGATTYTLHLSTDHGFSFILDSAKGIADTFYTIPAGKLDTTTQYFWRANATNQSGTSAWSDTFHFTTGLPASYALERKGWNMISLNMQPEDSSVDRVFGSLKGLVLVKDLKANHYIPMDTIYDLAAVRTGQGYQLYTDSTGETLSVFGRTIDPAVTPVILRAGWNMIAYFPHRAMPVDSALAGIRDNITIVKNNLGETYIPQDTINDIGNMKPGQGYKIHMHVPDTLYYPAAK